MRRVEGAGVEEYLIGSVGVEARPIFGA